MMRFVVYNAAGTILRSGVCQDVDLRRQAHDDGEFVLEAVANDAEHRIDMSTLTVVAK
jgi:hypothetical protein